MSVVGETIHKGRENSASHYCDAESQAGAAHGDCGWSPLRVMSHVGAADPEDDVFSNVGGVVGYAFQVAGYDERVQGIAMSLDAVRHGKVSGFKDLAVHVVHQIVTLEHGLRQRSIRGEKSIQGIAHH